MEPEDIIKNGNLMTEIKHRITVIAAFLSGHREALYVPPTIETIGLQFRKIFETIAFASLTANRSKYSAAYQNFSKHWEAAKLLKNLRRINPRFYPRPIIETKSDRPGVKSDWKDRDNDYLTQADLVAAHGKCGALMHGANPFGKPIDYSWYQNQFPVWRQRIINLLNSHQVHLLDDTGLYLFHMKEEGYG